MQTFQEKLLFLKKNTSHFTKDYEKIENTNFSENRVIQKPRTTEYNNKRDYDKNKNEKNKIEKKKNEISQKEEIYEKEYKNSKSEKSIIKKVEKIDMFKEAQSLNIGDNNFILEKKQLNNNDNENSNFIVKKGKNLRANIIPEKINRKIIFDKKFANSEKKFEKIFFGKMNKTFECDHNKLKNNPKILDFDRVKHIRKISVKQNIIQIEPKVFE